MADANDPQAVHPEAEKSAQTLLEDGSQSPEASTKKKRAGRIIFGIVGAAVIAGGVWYWNHETTGKYFQETNNAYIQSDSVIISPKVAGYVERVLVEENMEVRAGQPLIEIDGREYRAQAAQINAQMDVARSNAETIRAQMAEQHAGIAQAEAQLASAQSALAFARAEVIRYTPLAQSGAEPRERLEQLKNQQQQAQAQVDSNRAALLSATRRVNTLEKQVDQALSQTRVSKAQLDATNVNVGSTLIRSPINGRVANKTVQRGQLLQPGTRLLTLVQADTFYVEANFKETQLALVRPGQPVTIKVDALDDIVLHGKVESISPGTGAEFSILPPQNATGNFTKIVQRIPVRIALDAGPLARRSLVPGMSATVTVDTRSAKQDRARLEEEEAARQRSGQ